MYVCVCVCVRVCVCVSMYSEGLTRRMCKDYYIRL